MQKEEGRSPSFLFFLSLKFIPSENLIIFFLNFVAFFFRIGLFIIHSIAISGIFMRKFFLYFFVGLVAFLQAEESRFGCISYSSFNIGDDVQELAARKFLPPQSISIDREFIGCFDDPEGVHVLVNGWFMHTKDIDWYRTDICAPQKSWPPSPSIKPLFLSIHFIPQLAPLVFSKQGIAYLKEHQPIGARDFYTLNELRKRGIASYFSGCLTLTLDNPFEEREDVIYAVDVDREVVNYIRKNANCKVVYLTHFIHPHSSLLHDHEKRLDYAEQLLNKYRKAKCVVTSRLHVSMPCLAFETPVLFVGNLGNRKGGLQNLLLSCTKEELLQGVVHFDFRSPPENPKDYYPLRENLKKIVTDWVKKVRDEYGHF